MEVDCVSAEVDATLSQTTILDIESMARPNAARYQ